VKEKENLQSLLQHHLHRHLCPSSSSSTSNFSSHSTTSIIQKQTHKNKSNMPLFKLDVKFELPLYDGELNEEKLVLDHVVIDANG
jgi:hypothetical protein